MATPTSTSLLTRSERRILTGLFRFDLCGEAPFFDLDLSGKVGIGNGAALHDRSKYTSDTRKGSGYVSVTNFVRSGVPTFASAPRVGMRLANLTVPAARSSRVTRG